MVPKVISKQRLWFVTWKASDFSGDPLLEGANLGQNTGSLQPAILLCPVVVNGHLEGWRNHKRHSEPQVVRMWPAQKGPLPKSLGL